MNRAKLTLLALPIVAVIAVASGAIGGWVGGRTVLSSHQESARPGAEPICTGPAQTEAQLAVCLDAIEATMRSLVARIDAAIRRPEQAAEAKAEVLRQIAPMRQMIGYAKAYAGAVAGGPYDIDALAKQVDSAEAAAR